MRDKFRVNGQPAVYDEVDFERRVHVPRGMFIRTYDSLKDESGFKRNFNATGREQAHPLKKVLAAFCVIAYGERYDRADEFVRLSKLSIAIATKRVMSFIVTRFAPEYLRQPNSEAVAAILKCNA